MFSTVKGRTSADPKVWIRLVTSRNSRIQVLLDQEDDPELDDEWLTADEQLTCFRKSREQILGRVKGTELPSFQGPQSSEEYLVVRERVPSRTDMPSVREPGTNGNHAPIGHSQNSGSSTNSREIPISLENVFLKGTEDQYVTSPSGEALGCNVNMRISS